MGIYIIKEQEISEVIFKVEADSHLEAEQMVKEWKQKNHDEYRDEMDSNCYNRTAGKLFYQNEDLFNKGYCGQITFELKKDAKITLDEPLYFVEFLDKTFGNGPIWTYYGIKIIDLIKFISGFEKQYVIKPVSTSSTDLFNNYFISRKKYDNPEMIFIRSYEMTRRSDKK